MKRKSAKQITNSNWFPKFLTQNIYEFMTWFVNKVGAAKPFLPIVNEGLQYADNIIVIDKGLGAGFETLDPFVDKKFPRTYIEQDEIGQSGLYIMINSFHQLQPNVAHKLLKEIVDIGEPVVIVEGNNDSLWQVFGMTIIVPITVLLTAPFVKPFRLSRLIFTYVIPILPFVTLIDGFLVLFKLYAPEDLNELTNDLQSDNYVWRSGKMDNGRGGKIIYLLGYPINTFKQF